MRAETLTVKEKEFIEASRACGSSHLRVILGHVFPNALSSTIVNVTLGVSTAILQIYRPELRGPGRTAAHAGVGLHPGQRPYLYA
jgi:ABC-type microcin C transport system permease subunit YejE